MSDAQTLELLPPEATGHGLWLERVSLPPPAFIPGTEEFRDSLLAEAALVETVTNSTQQDLAVETWKNLKAFLDMVEKSRVATKAPVLSLQREIDGLASGLVTQVAAELKRITILCDSFQREQIRQQQEAERKIREEQERVARIAREEQERLDKLARDEAAKAAAAGATQEAIAAAEATTAQAAAEATARVQAIVTQGRQNIAGLASIVPARATGMQVREPWVFSVQDINALYAARPDLCNPPTPKTREINALISRGTRELPGLKIEQDVRTGVRV